MSSVSPDSSASNTGYAVEAPKFPFAGGLVPGELTDLQASLLMKYYDACIAVAGFGGNSPGGSCVSGGSGLSAVSVSTESTGKSNPGKKRRLRNRRRRSNLGSIEAVAPVAMVEHLTAVRQGGCYERMLVSDVGLGQWPKVGDVLALSSDVVLPNSELEKLSVQRVAPGAYHVGSVAGPSLLSALAATVLVNASLVDGGSSLANRLSTVSVPPGMRKFPLSLTDVLGGESACSEVSPALGLESLVRAQGKVGRDLSVIVDVASRVEQSITKLSDYESCFSWYLELEQEGFDTNQDITVSPQLMAGLRNHWLHGAASSAERNVVSVDFTDREGTSSGFKELRTSFPAGSHNLRIVNPQYGYSCVVFDKPVTMANVFPGGELVGNGMQRPSPEQTRCVVLSGEGEVTITLANVSDCLMMRCLFSTETDLFGIDSVPEVLAAAGLLADAVEYSAEENVVMIADIRYNETRQRPSEDGTNAAAVKFVKWQ
jgi:hypothetical protein